MAPAMISILILALCIILFVARPIPNAVTACLGCLLFVLTGICSVSEAFSGFSNSTVLLMFGMMVVGIAMGDTGIARLIGQKVTQWSGRDERRFILLAGGTSALMSTFLSNTAVIAIFLPIIASVSQADSRMNRKNLTLPVTMGAMFGGVCTLVGSTPQLTANGILAAMTGKELGMFDYSLPGALIFLVYMGYVLLIGYPMGKKIWGTEQMEQWKAEQVKETAPPVANPKKMVAMGIIFAFTIVFFIGGWLPTAVTAIIAAIACLVTGCTTQKSVIKNMDWSVVFVLAGCLGIATGINNGGAGELLGEAVSSVLHEGIHPVVIFGIFVVLTMIISNFITNSTAVVIVLPIALSLCAANGLNTIPFTLGIVFAANLTFSTPLANAQTAMTLVAGYKFSDYIRYTWLLDILVLVAILCVIPLLYPLTF